MASADIVGPRALLVGKQAWYTATYSPPTASLPIRWAWDNGTLGPTAAYSWSVPGVNVLTVTATSPCGVLASSLEVVVHGTIYRAYLPIVRRGR